MCLFTFSCRAAFPVSDSLTTKKNGGMQNAKVVWGCLSEVGEQRKP